MTAPPTTASQASFVDADDPQPMIVRKPWAQSAEFDITAMIDLVFMMNIFFLVTSLTNAMAEVDLPLAKRVTAADAEKSVVITLIAAGNQANVYIGDGARGQPLRDQDQDRAIREAMEDGLKQGKNIALIKAEQGVLYRDVNRVCTAASSIDGVKLHLAVTERD